MHLFIYSLLPVRCVRGSREPVAAATERKKMLKNSISQEKEFCLLNWIFIWKNEIFWDDWDLCTDVGWIEIAVFHLNWIKITKQAQTDQNKIIIFLIMKSSSSCCCWFLPVSRTCVHFSPLFISLHHVRLIFLSIYARRDGSGNWINTKYNFHADRRLQNVMEKKVGEWEMEQIFGMSKSRTEEGGDQREGERKNRKLKFQITTFIIFIS